MRRLGFAALIALATVTAMFFTACEINESAVEPMGGIYISAMDTTQGITLETAQIFLGSVPKGQRLPVFIGGLEAGQVEVTLKPGLLYPPGSQTVTVSPPETTFVSFKYSADDPPSTVTIESTQHDAIIAVDELLQPTIEVNVPFLIAAGPHTISLFKPGYTTNSLIIDQTLAEEQEYTFTFELEEATYGADVGDLFYDFTFDDDWGGQQTLGQYRGQVVLVSFWFSTCVPCMEEFPTIETVFQERAADGFRVLAINTGWSQDGQAAFEEVREEQGLSFPLLFNGFDDDWILNDLGIQNAPTNIMIGPDGVINDRRGSINYEELNAMIDAALGE